MEIRFGRGSNGANSVSSQATRISKPPPDALRDIQPWEVIVWAQESCCTWAALNRNCGSPAAFWIYFCSSRLDMKKVDSPHTDRPRIKLNIYLVHANSAFDCGGVNRGNASASDSPVQSASARRSLDNKVA
ncbi:hypothetical protein M5D96_002872 [Drosophila gunungcola]|uniref:Uncharacterized protein n=1 Tax=Drosophila gunungcola TaxID=103775 RepID=A0A9P9Z0V1_9MUSC|nr:hypothetical protein M5D96_002872 [Drosophila gunungcola]